MIGLFIEPEDTWLFRDGRPMDAAGSRPAKSLFPPSPTVLQGALRSHELALQKIDLSDKDAIAAAVGMTYDFRNFRMCAPLVAKRENGKITRYFPRPADWFPTKADSSDIRELSPEPRQARVVASVSDQDLPLLLYPRDFMAGKKDYGDWISETDLMKYFAGEAVIPVKHSELFGWENRLGIQLDRRRRTVSEGMIYQVQPVSLEEGVGLYVEFDGFSGWSEKGLLRIGGDNRAGRYEQIKPTLPMLGLQGDLPPKFKVYFSSPAWFEQGWKPADWGQCFDGMVKLQAAALARYEVLGGYDYAKQGDKAAQRYVPAGSIYYFEGSGKVRLKQANLTQSGAQIGFGQVILSEWK